MRSSSHTSRPWLPLCLSFLVLTLFQARAAEAPEPKSDSGDKTVQAPPTPKEPEAKKKEEAPNPPKKEEPKTEAKKPAADAPKPKKETQAPAPAKPKADAKSSEEAKPVAKKPRGPVNHLDVAPNGNVKLLRSAFGREYLLSGSVIPQAEAATSTGLAGKIIRFELFHDGVDMYESSQGLVVTQDLPTRRLITTFPIVEQDDEAVVIDFNGGMKRVFQEIWYDGSGVFDPYTRDSVAEVTMSRVFSVLREGRILTVRQSAQVRSRERFENEEMRYEIRYFISPYSPGKFEGKENTRLDSRYLRFFESQAILEPTTGRPVAKIALFDISKPVDFYYSSNTPKEYEQAVKDGILYWNRAFGREVIRAKKAPAKVTAPDATRNLVQWVPWDNAGFAYADVLLDPRTGRSQRGQAYMTSVFAVSGKARARRLLRAMHELDKEKPKDDKGETKASDTHEGEAEHAEHASHGLFGSSSVCRFDRMEFVRQYAAGLEAMLASDELTDEAVLRASQDYVREVVAHEVGHVLGLRHNFAGSLSATVSPKELDEWFKAYLTGEDLSKYKDKLTTSSMMEYSVFQAGCFVGWLIRETDKVLPHDKAAIQWGYADSADAREKKLLFATDNDMFRYGDVTVFDYGVEPVVAAHAEIASQIRNLPNRIIERFIEAKAPRDPRDVLPLEMVNLSPATYASSIWSEYSRMLDWMRSGARSLRLERDFDYIGDLNREERMKAHWKSLNDQVKSLGGADTAFFGFLPAPIKTGSGKPAEGVVIAPKLESAKLAERLQKLLDAPAYAEFVGLDEKKHKFTDEEKKLIVERGKQLFEKVEESLLQYVFSLYSRVSRDLGLEANGILKDGDIIAEFESRIIELARHVILAKDDSKTIEGLLSKSMIKVTDYKYKPETRQAAALALTDRIGSFDGWAKEAKGDINKKLTDDVNSMLNIANLKSFSDSMLSRPLREWYLKQMAILKFLPPVRPGS